MKSRSYLAWVAIFLAAAALQACGKSSSSSESGGTASQTGAVSVSLTDAPGDFDHVYITVKDIWFHTSDAADPRTGAWLKYPLAQPVTVDLLALSSGNMQSLWNNIQLPAGTYQQIRLFLEPTNPTAVNPAPAGHAYFNEIVIGSTTSPLYIPDADHGIRLAGAFGVTAGGTLNLAIDFDAGHDIVEFHEGTDYVLKPRLRYFDLDNAGAIIGKLSTGGSLTAPRFVIKAERLSTEREMADAGAASPFHVVRRWTVPRADGTFILSPLSTLVTSTWDVVIRGLNTETMIIKGVPITKGATAANGATDLAVISTTPTATNDYTVDGAIQSPTGAWVQFYQTLPAAGEYPYEIRFRHFNPLTGGFRSFKLNNDQIQVANFVSSGATLSFTPATPAGGAGNYAAVADAVLFRHSDPVPVTSSTTTVAFTTPLQVVSPYKGNSVIGSIAMNSPLRMNNKMDSGRLFAVHGGMIVNAIDVSSQMTGTTGNGYSIANLPGGDAATPLPGAFYGIDAVGWSSTSPLFKAIAIPQIVDLRAGDDAAALDMLPLW